MDYGLFLLFYSNVEREGLKMTNERFSNQFLITEPLLLLREQVARWMLLIQSFRYLHNFAYRPPGTIRQWNAQLFLALQMAETYPGMPVN